jgi:sodium-dependent dicarboxylate transporter 2/3/5
MTTVQKKFATRIKLVLFLAALLLATLAYSGAPEDLGEGSRRMVFIFVFALVMWVTEAIPLFATSLFVIGMTSWWVSLPEAVSPNMAYTDVFHAFSSPVIFLFLGGFILASAVQKQKIDMQMAGLLLRAFGTRPAMVLFGVMAITAIFSMWMSNTATTAMMIVLIQPFLAQLPETERYRKGLILAIPFAANIGGVGTPIGTPPNAIALGQLADRGLHISFVQWMLFGVPLVLLALLAMWGALYVCFRPHRDTPALSIDQKFKLHRDAKVVYATFLVTVGLWLTSTWHGVPTAVVALLPAVLLTMTGIINKDDFNRLEWNILVLIAGGIALGDGMVSTGVDSWIVSRLPLEGTSIRVLGATLAATAMVLSTVMSHTVATNLLLPIGLAAAAITGDNTDIQVVAILCAVLSSFAMGLPISTPPNAIAYSTGQISSRDMLLVGGLTSVLATLVVIVTGPFVIRIFLG